MIKTILAAACVSVMLAGSPRADAEDPFQFDGGVDAKQALSEVETGGLRGAAPPIAAPQAAGTVPAAQSRASADPASWTIMVFVNAKNNLEPYGFANVNQMEMVGSSPDVNVVVEMGVLNAWHGSRRYLVKKDNDPRTITSPVLQEIPRVDMGDWRHLVDFGTWAKKNFPARRYMLIVWNHGDGWRIRSGLGTLGISYDDETGHHISTPELGKALAAIGGVDVYGSDACLMQMAEVSYELKDNAGTIVGSEETEPMDGYTYNTLLQPIVDNPAATAEDIGRLAVKSYTDHYVGSNSQVTQSAVRSGALIGLIPLLDSWTSGVMSADETKLIKTSMDDALKFDIADNVDLLDFVRLVSAGTKDPSVRAQGRQVMDYLRNRLLVSNGTVGSAYANAQGLAIYLPAGDVSASYDALAWAKAAHWESFAKWAAGVYAASASRGGRAATGAF